MDRNYTGIVIIIYSCKKYNRKSKLLYTLLKHSLIDIKIHILNGDENLDREYLLKDEIIYVKCKDNYDSLYLKTKKIFKEIINIFPNLSGVIKMDDDIYPNIDSIKNMINFIKNSNINYCGKVSVITTVDGHQMPLSYHHISKCEENQNKKPLILPTCTCISGPCYYVSKKAINYFNKNYKDFFAEDIMVGLTFENSIIKPIVYPSYYNDKSYGYYTNIQNYKDNTQHDYLTFIKLHGGLGNQLFQVATGLSYCKKNNSLPILVYDEKWCSHFNINKSLNTIFKNINKLSYNDFEKLDIKYKLIKPENNLLDAYKYFSLPEIKTMQSNVFLDGYFQNIQYFYDNFEEIKNVILDDDNIDSIKKKYMGIENEYFIHIRRGDYIGNKLYEIDYDTYFNSALNMLIQCNESKIKLNVLSNDVEYCKSYNILNKFSSEIDITFIDSVDEIECFYLMTQFVGGILSNSSYCWWASYINNSDNKKFIIPKKWIDNKNIDMTFDKNVLRL